MNLSETAYVRTLNDGIQTGSKFELRWFTPTNEVPLCGHATLASAAVLFNVVGNPSDVLTFVTKTRGELYARRHSDGYICMDFPSYNTEKVDVDKEPFQSMIKTTIADLPYQDLQYSDETKTFIIRLTDSTKRSDFERFLPNISAMHECDLEGKHVHYVIAALKGCHDNDAVDDSGTSYDFVSRFFSPWNGVPEDPVTDVLEKLSPNTAAMFELDTDGRTFVDVIVTLHGKNEVQGFPNYDLLSRVFSPWDGLPEDPVTGSAHAVLSSYWSKQLKKRNLYARQCSKRGGEIKMTVKDNGRVDIAGQAVVMMKGKLTI
uniref:Phenazine biosynthesis-like domain-containing protein-like n=1 Tax=Saccoglossus kowalevskii TaxID=10224 RepID=A0ABM0M7A9_SACKO|nr:PREDICTED: phenazine biosynthesis-like domain-containing protein-like [Saccoglossus kowalevskii]